MADLNIFRDVFDGYAINGCIGDPTGKTAYAYLRVSSSMQAEEGRSGLPRQIQNIHLAAKENGYKIAWDCVYADDDSGFQFDSRPQLTRLRQEYRSPNRKANAVVIENIDRLSRNSDWHQGFLLDEMRKHHLDVVFWKTFNSRIERAVMGAIAQDGMEQEIQRMVEGNLLKAKSGRVTAKTPAYGYKLVDSNGRPDNARKDTHYAIEPEEALVVRYIFERIGRDGVSTCHIANELEQRCPPPKRMSHWEPSLLSKMIHNPVYKGEFASHRVFEEKIWVESGSPGLNPSGRYVIRRRFRPPEEWIMVSVPAIVERELWDMANRMLDKNAHMGRRNAHEPYLLTGVVRCATCGYSYTASRRELHKRGKTYVNRYYRCSSRATRVKARSEEINCNQGQVSCHYLDDSLWGVLCEILLDPSILLGVLDRHYQGDTNEQLTRQVRYLEDAIRSKSSEDEKLYRAYQAEVFDADEFRERRMELKQAKEKLILELAKVSQQTLSEAQYLEKRQSIIATCQRAQQSGVDLNAPFEVRQRTVKTVVDRVVLNVNQGLFRIEGVVNGTFPIQYPPGRGPGSGKGGGKAGKPISENGEIESNPVGMG